MAYGLIFYKEVAVKHGTVRLEISEENFTGVAKEIGYLQQLKLTIDGDDDPTSPITKTILNFTIVDAPDIPETSTTRYGNWSMFYTSYAYKYRVQVLYNGQIQWSGYITADNFEIPLVYRASLTITARDGIGHLADYEWDENPVNETNSGLVRVQDIIYDSMRLINLPMNFRDNTVYYNDLTIDGYEGVGSLLLNSKLFEGKTRYDALEMVLSSLALQIRYVGQNNVICDYMRYMPMWDIDRDEAALLNVKFVNNSGTLRRSAAVRYISDTISFDFNSTNEFESSLRDATQTDITYTAQLVSDEGTTSTLANSPAITTPSSPTVSKSHQWDGIGLLDPSKYTGGYDGVFIAANSTDKDMAVALLLGGVSSMYFGAEIQLENLAYTLNGGTMLAKLQDTYIKEIVYTFFVFSRDNPSPGYLFANEGGWTSTVQKITLTADDNPDTITLNVPTHIWPKGYVNYGLSALRIWSITFGAKTSEAAVYIANYACKGIYARVKSTKVTANDALNRVEKDTVKTVNSESNNVIKKITPDIGFLTHYTNVPMPFIYPNIFYWLNSDGVPAPAPNYWMWGSGDHENIIAIKHKELLMHYIDTNDVLEGDIISTDYDIMLDRKFKYDGTEFLLISGTLNYLTGIVEGAQLRTYQPYSVLWE